MWRWRQGITQHFPCCPSSVCSPSCHRWSSLPIALRHQLATSRSRLHELHSEGCQAGRREGRIIHHRETLYRRRRGRRAAATFTGQAAIPPPLHRRKWGRTGQRCRHDCGSWSGEVGICICSGGATGYDGIKGGSMKIHVFGTVLCRQRDMRLIREHTSRAPPCASGDRVVGPS